MAGRNSYDLTVERGIKQRHELACPAREKGARFCKCPIPAFIASATVHGRQRYSKTLRRIEAARSWRVRALDGDLPDDSPDDTEPEPTIEEVWRDFIRAAENGTALRRGRQTYTASTITEYDSVARNHILPRIGDRPASYLDNHSAQRLVDDMANDGKSVSRQNGAATAMQAMSRWASRRGTGQRVTDLDVPRVQSRTPTILTPTGMADLIDLCPTPGTRLFAGLAAYTGGRAFELVAIDHDDVDLDALTIHLPGTKSDAAERTVPILAPLLPLLEAARPASGPLLPSLRESTKLRAAYDGYYLTTRDAWDKIDPRPTPHHLRHNYISWLFAAGVPLPSIQTLAGHKIVRPLPGLPAINPGVTLDVYGHATEDHVEQARIVLDRWIAAQSASAGSM
jgi:integrase